ncbi:hypothetical protein N7492_007069 [Penicillium capsulatum]|uniref:Uncharacterized protein n=1 Tax=Penicillium capsulatum TaxID=69766 RepID=A0A9W9HZ51_9EURO|nr:hypothetical protein N7492_007069 [Penicillium capsulatum]
MAREAPSLQYDAEQGIVANEGGFSFLEELRRMRAQIEEMNEKTKKFESHRQSHLDLRQRVISAWVRDALHKDTERRKKEIRRLVGSDVRCHGSHGALQDKQY